MRTNTLASLAVVLVFTGALRAQTSQPPAPRPAQTPPGQPPAPPAQKPYQPEFDIPKQDGSGAPPRTDQPISRELYVIGAQDLLNVTVTDEADLTNKYRVDSDGTISMPYLMRVPVGGLSLNQAQVKIASMLKTGGFLINPQVRIEVDQYKSRSVTITGEVRTPQKVTMSGTTMSLLEALAVAGSTTQNASNDVIVQHQAKAGEKTPEPIYINRKDLELGRADVTLQDGDIINVPVAKRFYIQGFVKNPGYYVLDLGTTVSQAIILAGGLTDRGSDRRLSVSRLVNGKTAELPIKLNDKVLPGDEINVKGRFF